MCQVDKFQLFAAFNSLEAREACKPIFVANLRTDYKYGRLKQLVDAIRSSEIRFSDGHMLSNVAWEVLTEVVQSTGEAGDSACKELCDCFMRDGDKLKIAVQLLPQQHFLVVLENTESIIEIESDSVLREMILDRLKQYRNSQKSKMEVHHLGEFYQLCSK